MTAAEEATLEQGRLEGYARQKGLTLEEARAELERRAATIPTVVVEHPGSMTGGEVEETVADSAFKTISRLQARTEEVLRFASEAAGVAKVASELGLSVAFDPVERVVIITTGRDLHGNEASRLMAAAPHGVGIAFRQGGKVVRFVKKVDKAADEAGDVARTKRIVSRADDASSKGSFTFNMVDNPGPLAAMRGNPAAAFAGGRYNAIVLDQDLILYRGGASGGGRNALGQWFTREAPTSRAHIRIDSAVPTPVDRSPHGSVAARCAGPATRAPASGVLVAERPSAEDDALPIRGAAVG